MSRLTTDEKLQVNAELRVAGKKTSFVSLRIDQEFGEHHQFWIQLDYDTLHKSFMDNPLDNADLVGEKVYIKFIQGTDEANCYKFIGVITEVGMTGKDGKHGFVELKGSSGTIMLERGKRLEVYSDMSLRRAVELMTMDVPQGYLAIQNSPLLTNKFDFLFQFKESDWQFLQRLAAIFGETLYYTGTKLIFGKMDDDEVVPLVYDKEITSFRLCSRLLANTFQNYQYLPEQNTTMKKTAEKTIPQGTKMVLLAASKGDRLLKTKKPIKLPADAPVGDNGELIEVTARKKLQIAANTVCLMAESKTCDPRIGKMIKFSMPKGMSGKEYVGTYRVTKISHFIDQNHRYHSHFEAMPSGLKYMPVPELKMPVVTSLIATVKSNEDPRNQGRVQIDFDFTNNYSMAWLRVMTPDAGSSKTVAKNRGLVAIPEKGDQVMIGFEMGDPNRPYVMGSMGHMDNWKGGGANNHLRTFTDGSNNYICLDKVAGIIIKDKDGSDSTIELDGNKNIILTAQNDVTINAGGNFNINVGKNMTTSVGENQTISVAMNSAESVGMMKNTSIAGDHLLNVTGKMTEFIQGDMESHTEKDRTVSSKKGITSSSDGAIQKHSQKNIQNNSGDKSKLF